MLPFASAWFCAARAAARSGIPAGKASVQQGADYPGRVTFLAYGGAALADYASAKSFGLIQPTPACGEAKGSLLPNGHPNLTQDMSSAQWATSVFNPPIILDSGVQTDAQRRKSLKAKDAGCTDAQYNMMAAGAFNSGNSAVLGSTSYNARAQMYVTYITQHYKQFAQPAGWPDPY